MSTLLQSAATFRQGALHKASFLAFVYADLLLTLMGARQEGFHEVNPLMRSLLEDPGALLLVKGLIPLLIAWLTPARLLLPSIFLLIAIVAWNLTQLMAFI